MKLVCGVGINDADYVVKPIINGKREYCPIYSKWFQMLQRCHTEYGKKKNPTYSEDFVCDDWLRFSVYREWCLSSGGEDKSLHLDKDILFKANKLYSPETCVFVPRFINNIVLCKMSSKGQHPIGVHFEKESGRFKSQANVDGKYKNLGRYSTAKEAHKAWQKQKILNIEDSVKEYSKMDCFNTHVADSLMQRVWELRLDLAEDKETVFV